MSFTAWMHGQPLPQPPTHCQHRPRSTSGQHLPAPRPDNHPDAPAVPHPCPAGSRRPSAVGLKNPVAPAAVCLSRWSRADGEGGREGKEGEKEQRQRIAAPASQHIPNPARLPIPPALSGHRPRPASIAPDKLQPCPVCRACCRRSNSAFGEKTEPRPQNPEFTREQRPGHLPAPARHDRGGHLTFSTFCHIYDMTPVPSSTHLLSNPNSARFAVRSYRRTNS